jgi:hypothetical protein
MKNPYNSKFGKKKCVNNLLEKLVLFQCVSYAITCHVSLSLITFHMVQCDKFDV